MVKYNESTLGRTGSPFDGSALERQRRMGLVNEKGKPEQDTIAILARLYAGLYYDNLCDYFNHLSDVKAVCRELSGRLSEEDARPRFLAICTAYDAIYHSLPEPVWWMSGSMELIGPFADGFLRRLAEFAEETEEVM